MKKVSIVNDVVTAWGMLYSDQASMTVSAPDATIIDVPDDTPVEVGWIKVLMVDRVMFQPPEITPPTISPSQFYFLWSMPEQVAIEEIRHDDQVVNLFLRRLDDPRTNQVVLADVVVKEVVRHMVDQLVAKGLIAADDAEARYAAILSGKAR